MRKPGRDYIPYEEFEHALKTAGISERDFISGAKLGLYSVREWRRQRTAPYWAGLLAALMGQRAPVEQVSNSFIFAELTDTENEEFENATAERQAELFEVAKARYNAKR